MKRERAHKAAKILTRDPLFFVAPCKYWTALQLRFFERCASLRFRCASNPFYSTHTSFYHTLTLPLQPFHSYHFHSHRLISSSSTLPSPVDHCLYTSPTPVSSLGQRARPSEVSHYRFSVLFFRFFSFRRRF